MLYLNLIASVIVAYLISKSLMGLPLLYAVIICIATFAIVHDLMCTKKIRTVLFLLFGLLDGAFLGWLILQILDAIFFNTSTRVSGDVIWNVASYGLCIVICVGLTISQGNKLDCPFCPVARIFFPDTGARRAKKRERAEKKAEKVAKKTAKKTEFVHASSNDTVNNTPAATQEKVPSKPLPWDSL